MESWRALLPPTEVAIARAERNSGNWPADVVALDPWHNAFASNWIEQFGSSVSPAVQLRETLLRVATGRDFRFRTFDSSPRFMPVEAALAAGLALRNLVESVHALSLIPRAFGADAPAASADHIELVIRPTIDELSRLLQYYAGERRDGSRNRY